MSSRYDTRTTTFSPEGRLYQVEYAINGIAKAAAAIGVVTKDGVVFATERRQRHPLLDAEAPALRDISGEKVYKVDNHIAVAVAGLTADANLLVDYARRHAQSYLFQYEEPMPAEDLCQLMCDVKQSYTQYGGVRPFGVSCLVGAWDKFHGFQLYQTDPSGNYWSWKAQAIGQNDGAAQGMLKQDWKEGMTLKEGALLCLKVLGKTLDAHLSPDRLEVASLTRAAGATPRFHILTEGEVKPLIEEAEKLRKAEEDAAEAKRKGARDE